MVLPLLTTLEVRLTPRSLYSRDEKLERMVRDDGRIPVPYNVSIRNTGEGAPCASSVKSGPSVPMKTARR